MYTAVFIAAQFHRWSEVETKDAAVLRDQKPRTGHIEGVAKLSAHRNQRQRVVEVGQSPTALGVATTGRTRMRFI